jgi:hypothetical protein
MAKKQPAKLTPRAIRAAKKQAQAIDRALTKLEQQVAEQQQADQVGNDQQEKA